VFIRPPNDAGQAVKLTFLLLVTTVWIGSIDSAREIIKEKGVFVRETAVGVKISSYLASKAIVLFSLAAIQAVVLTAIVLAFQPLHEAKSVYLAVMAIVVLTAFAAVSMGLLVSAFVRNQDQATSFIPLILIPQLFFGGSIVATAEMSSPMQVATKAVVTQWSYAGLGAAIDMNGRIHDDPKYGKVARFSHDYFTLTHTATYLILAGFTLLTMVATGWILKRRARS
jgi:ABC-type multidrug transport system permease subunit